MSSSEPLINRFLWVPNPTAAPLSPGALVEGRYQVVASRIWRDTQPEQPAYVPETLPEEVIPYLRLYPQRLHVPEVYGFCQLGNEPSTQLVVLLENIPVDSDGDLYPSLVELWQEAPTVRQVYWLWQILQLWTPLAEQGVASSLLMADNIRVQGWRVWLRELFPDAVVGVAQKQGTSQTPSLSQLAECWLEWTQGIAEPLAERLQDICQQMRRGNVGLEAIATQLNQLLLEQSAPMPLRQQVAGASDQGPQRLTNEDSCYPIATDLERSTTPPNDRLIPFLSLVCDGIGGHEGGEVASERALQTLKQLLHAYLIDIGEQTELLTPDAIEKQLAEIIRVVNNLIATQNDSQGRELRQRMGTTLIMALQLPQKIPMPDGSEFGNGHELYLAHLGDSRAYWITSDYCQQLTVDDDVAAREVRMGRSLYREALKRADGGALTQALGTRDAEQIYPTITRFIIEEDGLLLLCSDGLSDNGWVEKSWRDYAKPVLKNKLSLADAVQSWIHLANENNGHDNTSIVLSSYLLSPEPPALFAPQKVAAEEFQTAATSRLQSELTAASRALLYDGSGVIERQTPVDLAPRRRSSWLVMLGVMALLLIVSVAGYGAWMTLKLQGSQPPQQSQPQSPK